MKRRQWEKLPYRSTITIGEFTVGDDQHHFESLQAVRDAVRVEMEKNANNMVEVLGYALLGIHPEITRGEDRMLSFAVAAALESLKGMTRGDDWEYDDEDDEAA